MTNVKVRRALISVSDKTGLLPFVEALRALDVDILSTGGTFKMITEAGHEAMEVGAYTDFPEMMDGRVKTLHPRVHGGLLGRRGPDTDDSEVMAAHGIVAIDLLVVNLYPFEAAVASDPLDLANAIENIDIGGPAMLRSAAKNFDSVAVIVDKTDYAKVMQELQSNQGELCYETRHRLAVKTFVEVARYDAAIANYLAAFDPVSASLAEFPSSLTLQYQRRQQMRYGENPHQDAAFYVENNAAPGTLGDALQLQGKALSYNNIADTDAALECVKSLSAPGCVIVKHANPCGVAEAENIDIAYQRAFATDPTSAFGGIIAFNREVDEQLAARIVEQQFVEVIVAPGYTEKALARFATKKNVRLLKLDNITPVTSGALASANAATVRDYKKVAGGLLVQSKDIELLDENALKVVTQRQPGEQERTDMLFAWTVAKYVKSNAIVYARDKMTIGVGAGQMAGVHSAQVAGVKAAEAGLEVKGAVMASDAFFPFRDSIDTAAAIGITAVIQPGGSIRDQEVIDAADEAGMTMIFTGMRHFRH